LSAGLTIARPIDEVFEYVADYRHVPEVMEGVRSWRPLGRQARGKGARYRVELDAAHLTLNAVLRITAWEPPRAIAWTAESAPVKNEGKWHFSPGQDGTDVELAVAYDPPGGIFGDFVARGVERLLEGRIRNALEGMKRAIERAA